MEFSRQECWSGLHSLLQGIFLTQGLNLGPLHCKADSLPFKPPRYYTYFNWVGNISAILDTWFFLTRNISSPIYFPISSLSFYYLIKWSEVKVTQSCPWTVGCQAPLSMEFSRKNTGVGSFFWLFPFPWDRPNPGSNSALPHCRWIPYHLSHQGIPYYFI